MTDPARTHRIAVVGAGVMGTGIAALAVGSGLSVVLHDIDDTVTDRAESRVRQQLRLARLVGALPADQPDGDLVTTTDLTAVASATAVVESVTEQSGLKKSLLHTVSGLVGEDTVLMSNTSAIPIDELAEVVRGAERFLGAHFMNPPYLIRAIEVVRGPRTGAAAMTAALALLTALGQQPVVVCDGLGFVVNRILQRMINEAARIVEEGIAGPEDVDAVITGCLGHRTGPLGTADIIGLDNVVDSLRVLLDRTGDEGYRPCDLLVAKVKAGDHGRKTGRGFFEHGGVR